MYKYTILFTVGFLATLIYQAIVNNNALITGNKVTINLDGTAILIVLLLISNLIALIALLRKKAR